MNSTSHNAFAFLVNSLLHPPVQATQAAKKEADVANMLGYSWLKKTKIVQTVGQGKRVF